MAQAGARGVPAFLRSWFRAPSRLHLDDPSSRDGLVPSLNGLRATSVMLVLVTHTLGHAGLGNFGVLVFFVISGFLITRLFLAERKRSGHPSCMASPVRNSATPVPWNVGTRTMSSKSRLESAPKAAICAANAAANSPAARGARMLKETWGSSSSSSRAFSKSADC